MMYDVGTLRATFFVCVFTQHAASLQVDVITNNTNYTSYIKHYTLTTRLDAEGSSQSGKHRNGDFQDFTPDGFVFVFHGYCFFYLNAETRRHREPIIWRELSARSFLLVS